MGKTAFCTTLITLACLALLSACRTGETEETGETEDTDTLEQVQTFGQDGDGYIAIFGFSFTYDRAGHIYLSDSGRGQVLKYTVEGEFVKAIGSPGRGPAEFGGRFFVQLSGDRLIVSENTLLRVSTWTLEGDFLSSYAFDHNYSGEFAVSDSFVARGGKAGRFQSAGLEEENRFHLFDLAGNRLHAFGRYWAAEEEMPVMFQMAKLKWYDGQLHVIYLYSPKYQIYNSRGILLADYDLEEIIPMDWIESSRVTVTNTPSAPSVTGYFGEIDIVDDRVYLCRWMENAVIFEELKLYGTELEHIRTHHFDPRTYGVGGVLDFFYHPDRQSFYTLETVGGFRVGEYRIKEETVGTQ